MATTHKNLLTNEQKGELAIILNTKVANIESYLEIMQRGWPNQSAEWYIKKIKDMWNCAKVGLVTYDNQSIKKFQDVELA